MSIGKNDVLKRKKKGRKRYRIEMGREERRRERKKNEAC